MKLTIDQTEKLLSEGNLAFKSLGLSMLLTNLRTFHSMDPTQYTVEDCNNELNAFLEKFSAVMDSDFELIMTL